MGSPLSQNTPSDTWPRLLQVENTLSTSFTSVCDGSGTQSAIQISTTGVNLVSGVYISGQKITATAAEINVLDGITAGSASISKGMVLDADGRITLGYDKFIKGAILEGVGYRFYDSLDVLSSGNAIQATGDYHKFKLAGNVTLGLTTATVSGQSVAHMNIIIEQDEVGGRTLTWPGSVRWPVGQSGYAATGANRISIFEVLSYDGGSTWLGRELASNIV